VALNSLSNCCCHVGLLTGRHILLSHHFRSGFRQPQNIYPSRECGAYFLGWAQSWGKGPVQPDASPTVRLKIRSHIPTLLPKAGEKGGAPSKRGTSEQVANPSQPDYRVVRCDDAGTGEAFHFSRLPARVDVSAEQPEPSADEATAQDDREAEMTQAAATGGARAHSTRKQPVSINPRCRSTSGTRRDADAGAWRSLPSPACSR
jgi:hypothetical protein